LFEVLAAELFPFVDQYDLDTGTGCRECSSEAGRAATDYENIGLEVEFCCCFDKGLGYGGN